MPDHARRARDGKPRRAAEARAEQHGDHALEKIAQQRQQPHARAERSCRVCRARVAASQGAHVLMEDVFGDQDRYAQRADQIAQRQTGEICSRHTDTTFSYEVVLIP